MGKAKPLSEFEKSQINAFKRENLSNRKIATLIKRSPSVVDRYVKDPENYNKKNHQADHLF